MTRTGQYHTRRANARQRRRRTARERLARDRQQVQQAAEALHHTFQKLGLSETLLAQTVVALGVEVLVLLWRHVQAKSPAAQSRWG
jgi:hypothetical protein